MSPLSKYLGVAQLVARYLGVVEAASSSLVCYSAAEYAELNAMFHSDQKRGCVRCYGLPRFSFFVILLVRFQSLMYASHTKSCLLLGGRIRRA